MLLLGLSQLAALNQRGQKAPGALTVPKRQRGDRVFSFRRLLPGYSGVCVCVRGGVRLQGSSVMETEAAQILILSII